MTSLFKNYVRTLKLYNVLGLVSGCLIITSLLFPWWRIVVEGRPGTNVYPYVISGDASLILGYERTAVMIVLTCILVACVALCFVGSTLKGKKGKTMLGAVGIILLLVAVCFIWRISTHCELYRVPMQGNIVVLGFTVTTGFQVGLYLAILAGCLCIISIALHEKIKISRSQ